MGIQSTSPRLLGAVIALAAMSGGATGCAAFLGDAVHDARKACDKKDGPSCFFAGNAVVEKEGATTSEAIKIYARGCASRHAPSCDALGTVKGPLRVSALSAGCNSGDLVSCTLRANEYGTDENDRAEARTLRHQVCKKSVTVVGGLPAREIEGIAESCAALARMIASGQGGGRDEVAAAKLDVLAATLRNEALFRHEREDDGKVLPKPAGPEAAPQPKKKGVLIGPKVDPGIAERAKFRREYEARRTARDAWMASVQASVAAAQNKDRNDPSLPAPTALERAAASSAPGGAQGASSCQACADNCGSMSKCSGDDFAGGRCGHLRCAEGGPCPDFDACVGECTAKAETCARACGECSDPSKGAKP